MPPRRERRGTSPAVQADPAGTGPAGAVAPRLLVTMTALSSHFGAPPFWLGWLLALALAGLLVWSVGPRWWSLAVAAAAVVAPLALLLLAQAVTRD